MRRPLKPNAARDFSGRHGRYMGYHQENEVARVQDAISRKGELYNIDRFPDQGVAAQARADFDNYLSGTPAMQAIGNDMRSFYGLGQQTQATAALSPEAAPASSPVPARAQAKERAKAHIDTNQYETPAGPTLPQEPDITRDIYEWEQKIDQENNNAMLLAALGSAGLVGAGVSKAAEPSDEEIIQRYLDSL